MRAWWTGAALAALGGLGLGVAACNARPTNDKASTVEVPLRSGWNADQRHDFRANLRTSTHLSTQGPNDLTLELKGKLQISVLSASGSQVELALAFEQAELSAQGGAQDPQLLTIAKELTQPAWFQLDSGSVAREAFVRGLSASAVSAWRTLAAAVQLPDTSKSLGPWVVSEQDGTGRYQAKYVRAGDNPGVLNKQKLHFEDLLLTGQIKSAERARLLPKVVRSAQRVTFDERGLRTVTGDDEFESQLMGATLRSTSHLELERTGTAPVTHERARLLAELVEISPGAAYGVAPKHDAFDALRWDGRSFEQLAGELQKRAKQEKTADLAMSDNGVPRLEVEQAEAKAKLAQSLSAFSSMVALMRQKPETLTQAKRAILARSPAAASLVDAVGSAGTPAAQQLLAELLETAELPTKVLGAAATSLIRVEQPTPETLAVLERLTLHPVLADFGVFGLGIASRSLRRAGDVATADKLAARLIQGLLAAPERPEQVRYLRGLANAAAPQSVEAVRPLLDSKDEQLRSAALEALRLVELPAVDELTAERMVRDERGSVRAAALRVASARTPSVALDAAVGTASLNDQDPAIRQQAVELLARWLPQRKALRARLQEVVGKEQQSRIRDVALAALKKAS